MDSSNFSAADLKEKLEEINSEAAYILKPDVFEQEFDLLLDAFRKYYDKVNIAYSFKTNYIPDLLNIVRNKNGYAEVVSIMELELALRVGFPPSRIFFNGPFKHRSETSDYLKRGVLVNVDSFSEYLWIASFARESGVKCRIGLRLNFGLSESPSRFGIDVNDEDLNEIITQASTSQFISLESLHFHYASRDLSTWEECTGSFLKFLRRLDSSILQGFRYMSIGGGFFSRMSRYLEDQIPFDVPNFDEYSLSSIKKLSAFLGGSAQSDSVRPEILIEPGTALASKALDFVAQVVSVKNISDVTYINTTASKYNMNPSPSRINSPIRILRASLEGATRVENGLLCGYTCIESDIIHNQFNGEVSPGDFIIFEEVGAYSVVMKPPFILPDVGIIEFDELKRSFKTIRDRQEFDEIFGSFRFLNR